MLKLKYLKGEILLNLFFALLLILIVLVVGVLFTKSTNSYKNKAVKTTEEVKLNESPKNSKEGLESQYQYVGEGTLVNASLTGYYKVAQYSGLGSTGIEVFSKLTVACNRVEACVGVHLMTQKNKGRDLQGALLYDSKKYQGEWPPNLPDNFNGETAKLVWSAGDNCQKDKLWCGFGPASTTKASAAVNLGWNGWESYVKTASEGNIPPLAISKDEKEIIPQYSTESNSSGPRLLYESLNMVDTSLKRIERLYSGKAKVIVGKIKRPENEPVATRIRIYSDGSYSTLLYDGRQLAFFAHGYDPLFIYDYKEVFKNVFDAGTKQFSKAKPEDIRSLSGALSLEGNNKSTTKINYELKIRNRMPLFKDWGHNGGPITVTAARGTLSSGDSFFIEGLSRIPYVLVISAHGYIKKDISIDENEDKFIELGEIELKKALTLKIRYKTRIRHKDGLWIEEEGKKSASLIVDGVNKFLFTNERDGLGTKLALRMKPKHDGIEAGFFYYKANSFFDFGNRKLSEAPAWNDIDTSSMKGYHRAMLEDGHLYLFRIKDVRDIDIEMFFEIQQVD